MVIGTLVDDLGHQDVECSKRNDQAHHVKRRRQLEAASQIDDILDSLLHQVGGSLVIVNNIFN